MEKFIKDGSMDVNVYLSLKKHASNDALFSIIQNISAKSKDGLTNSVWNKALIYKDIDARTTGEVLPLRCPTMPGSSIQSSLGNFSIAELKLIVSEEEIKNFYCTEDKVKRFRCSSPEKSEKIKDLLALYDEQVERLFNSEKK